MKITMYELLGLVKDGKAPKKVRYNDEIYDTESSNNFSLMIYETTGKMSDDGEVRLFLNDEIEILDNLEEEKKIPEKIKDKYCSQISKVKLAQKYNEIIDYLQYLKSKGE